MAATSEVIPDKAPGFFTQLYTLKGNLERKKFILQATFRDVFHLLNQQHHSIRYHKFALQRLMGLNKDLNDKQIIKIRTLFLRNFSRYAAFNSLHAPVVGFLAGAIEEDVIGEYLKVAFTQKSDLLIKNCMAFINSQTNFSIQHEEFITITFTGSNLESNPDYIKAQKLIEIIAKHIEPDSIKIHLTLNNFLNEAIVNFVISTAPYIRTLMLYQLDDQSVKFLLDNCLSLSNLWIKSKKLTAEGLSPIVNLSSLAFLTLNYCHQLQSLPELSRLTSLRQLDISYCHLNQLPPLNVLTSLEILYIYGCHPLEYIPEITQLKNLKTLNFSECRALKNFPVLGELSSLDSIALMNCEALECIPPFPTLRSLKTINFHNCKNVEEIESFEGLENLTGLNLHGCTKLKRLPSLQGLKQLKSLNLSLCAEVEEIPGLSALVELQTLNLFRCRAITSLPHLNALTKLDLLCLAECENLVYFPSLDPLVNLRILNISFCRHLKYFPVTTGLRKLVSIKAQMCTNLETLPDLISLTALTTFDLSGCSSLTQAVRKEALHALMEKNYHLATKLLYEFEIEDTTSFEKVIAEKNLTLYLQSLHRFSPPNQELRMNILTSLLDTDLPTALNYLSDFAIVDSEGICEILRVRAPILEFMSRCEIALVDADSLPLTLSCFQAILENNDERFQTILSKSTERASLECVKGNRLLKEFILRHLPVMWENKTTRKILNALYPPEDPGNECFYPLEIQNKDRTIYFKLTPNHFHVYAIEIILRWGKLLDEARNKNFPPTLEFFFYGQPGIDAGGISRQGVSHLFHTLVSDTRSNLFVRRINGFFMPHAARREFSFFESLGKVAGSLLNAEDRYPIGELFDLVFYEKLQGLTPEEVSVETEVYESRLKKLDPLELLSLCDSMLNPAELPPYLYEALTVEDRLFYNRGKETLQVMKQFFRSESFQVLDPHIRERIDHLHPFSDNLTEGNFAQIKTEIFEEFIDVYFHQLLAIHAFARGIATSFPLIVSHEETDWVVREWKDFQELPTNVLSNSLQGTLTKELLMHSLEVGCADADKEREVASWMEEWLQRSEISHLRKFLVQVTGAPTIIGKVKISLSEQHERISYSTCFSTMKVPTGIHKETFFAELDALNDHDQPANFDDP